MVEVTVKTEETKPVEAEAKPEVVVETKPVEVVVEPVEIKPEAEAKPGALPEKSVATLAKPVKDWRDDRIAVLTARLAEAKKAALPVEPKTPAAAGTSEEEINRRVEAEAQTRAQVLAAQAAFNAEANGVVEKGRGEFTDFDERVTELRKLQDPTSQVAYENMIRAAIETGEGPKLIHALGGDLNEASRIMGLSPTKMAVELTKIAVGVPGKLSAVPKPITPVGGRTAPHTTIDPTDPTRADNLSTAEWMARRQAQLSKSGARP